MNRQTHRRILLASGWIAGFVLSAAMAETSPEPTVSTVTWTSKDAPEVKTTPVARGGQNVEIEWGTVAVGAKPGSDAYYFFGDDASYGRMKETSAPFMTQVDIATGAIRSFFGDKPIRLLQKEKKGLLDSLGGLTETASDQPSGGIEVKTNWAWGKPSCGTCGKDGLLYLGATATSKVGAATDSSVLRYLPEKDAFELFTELPAPPLAMDCANGTIYVLLKNLVFGNIDELSLDGDRSFIQIPPSLKYQGKEAKRSAGLVHDRQGYFYTAIGPEPWQVFSIKPEKGRISTRPLLPDASIRMIEIRTGPEGPWCRIGVTRDNVERIEYYRFENGNLVACPKPLNEMALTTRNGNQVTIHLERLPPVLDVTMKDGKTNSIPLVIKDVPYDNIKSLTASPDGRYLYGAGWPVCNIWRFDPATGIMTKLGKHYVIYEMHPWNDEIWMSGYYGVKLFRWKPEEPWTFDYDKHYFNKSIPGNLSPWGDKDVSNPRLVCKFRYLKRLNCRRPAGMAITPDGCAYVGARTPCVEYLDSHYGGAVNWYDPKTETIGQIREPFLHHTVKDLCTAGPNHVLAVASSYACPYRPFPGTETGAITIQPGPMQVPESYDFGKLVLIDTKERKVVQDISPTGGGLSYAEEGEPGRVVIAGDQGRRYQGDGIRGVLLIYDVNEKRVVYVVRTPFRVNYFEYNVLPFKRGPDNKIYFYGKDESGTALYRIDSRDGTVEPVLRSPEITEVASYNNNGASFEFLGDRVYFGCKQLVSVPIETVLGTKGAQSK